MAGFLGGLLISCAADTPEVVDAELSHLSNAAAAGVSTIERALRDGRMMTPATGDGSPGLIGEGLRAVDAATRALSRLEDDPRASEAQRLDAVVRQARAWDDAARVIAFAWHGVHDLDEAPRFRCVGGPVQQERARAHRSARWPIPQAAGKRKQVTLDLPARE